LRTWKRGGKKKKGSPARAPPVRGGGSYQWKKGGQVNVPCLQKQEQKEKKIGVRSKSHEKKKKKKKRLIESSDASPSWTQKVK